MALASLPSSVEAALTSSSGPSFDLAIEEIATAFGAVTVTLHRADNDESVLLMVASKGLPPPVAAVTERIRFGKGMAGLCVQRREPVTVCNLQSDSSGVAKPSAKLTGVEGAIAVPVFDEGGRLAGALGVGKPGAHDYTDDEKATLASCAALLGKSL